MIIPDNLSLEELIGALKADIATRQGQDPTDDIIRSYAELTMLEVLKRELDKKEEKK